MKSLEVIQSTLSGYCVCPTDVNDTNLAKTLRVISIFIFYIVEIPTILASAAYVLELLSTDLENALYGYFQGSVLVYVTYAVTVGLTIRESIQRIFLEFQNCYERSKIKRNSCQFQYYKN